MQGESHSQIEKDHKIPLMLKFTKDKNQTTKPKLKIKSRNISNIQVNNTCH